MLSQLPHTLLDSEASSLAFVKPLARLLLHQLEPRQQLCQRRVDDVSMQRSLQQLQSASCAHKAAASGSQAAVLQVRHQRA